MTFHDRHRFIYAIAIDVIDNDGYATVATVSQHIDDVGLTIPGQRWSPVIDARARQYVRASLNRLTDLGHLRRTFRHGYGEYIYEHADDDVSGS